MPHLLEQVRKGFGERDRSADEDNLDSRRQRALFAAVGFPDSPSRPVAPGRASHPAAHREADPTTPIPEAPERDKAPPLIPMSSLKERLDVRTPPEAFAPREGQHAGSFPSHAPLDGEAPTPFRAPPLQHVPPPLSFHPLTEPMRLAPATPVRLKGSLHELAPLPSRADVVYCPPSAKSSARPSPLAGRFPAVVTCFPSRLATRTRTGRSSGGAAGPEQISPAFGVGRFDERSLPSAPPYRPETPGSAKPR